MLRRRLTKTVAVMRKNTATYPRKLRIVFNAAAEFAGTSLNKNLLQGPDMTNSLVGVLLVFRKGKVVWLLTWKR